MVKQLLESLFCVDDNGRNRVSLTKAGSAIKSFALYVGGSLSALTFFGADQKAGVVLMVISASLTGLGSWLKDCGDRNSKK